MNYIITIIATILLNTSNMDDKYIEKLANMLMSDIYLVEMENNTKNKDVKEIMKSSVIRLKNENTRFREKYYDYRFWFEKIKSTNDNVCLLASKVFYSYGKDNDIYKYLNSMIDNDSISRRSSIMLLHYFANDEKEVFNKYIELLDIDSKEVECNIYLDKKYHNDDYYTSYSAYYAISRMIDKIMSLDENKEIIEEITIDDRENITKVASLKICSNHNMMKSAIKIKRDALLKNKSIILEMIRKYESKYEK